MFLSASSLADSLLLLSERLSEAPVSAATASKHAGVNLPPPAADDAWSDVGAFHAGVQSALSGALSGSGPNAPPGKLLRAESFADQFHAFTHAVSWEADAPFFLSLLLLHLSLLSLALLSHKRPRVQAPLFLLLAGAIYLTEPLNSFLAARHRRSPVTSQDYFDARGAFAAAFYAGPLLVALVVVVGNLVREAGGMLVEVKAMEMKRRGGGGGKGGKKGGKKEN
ncbi:hypothetical protein TeGR_g8595 [Tetraparma gracilis]|uniref:Transmembrane protein 18 n=1 Tax=Tetraparma gracilis TaxID=2962635 RepID=A0ABQ6M9B7_9STRA|nr:hypothetical protein TeGR_g8595 [Tetraparma gracilis]